MSVPVSPLLDPRSTTLDERRRGVIERVSAAERAHILALPSDDPLDPKRRFRVEATGPELFGQPDAIRATLASNETALDAVAARLAGGFRRLVLVGAGDSLAVMIAARSALESMLHVPCEPVQSLEFAYYQGALVDGTTAVVALSSSGETTRTVEALLVAQHRGAYTVALTNTAGSTLETEASTALRIEATRVGWPTQSSTAALALLLELAVRVGELRGAPGADALREALDAMPATMAAVLQRIDAPIAAIAEQELAAPTVLFSGGGPNLAAAVVGAAKVKECTPLRATEIQVEEYHHYNSQKAGEALVLLVPSGPSVPRAVDTGTDAHRWGGRLHVVTTEGERAFDALHPESLIALPAVPEALSPLLYLLPAQLVGYHLGLAGFRAAEAAGA
ncbi:SIS domain-containing protein [uncultured Amnibacterium sp.]|uniref:SIS domain-containing protein n=1 Tax=uncultured Amnibacterium sp. TaxID=1631851 RepID=UPI0035CB6C9E